MVFREIPGSPVARLEEIEGMCPFVEASHTSCATHLTMNNIASAFAHCADRYENCPVYWTLLAQSHGPHETCCAEANLVSAAGG